MNLMQIHGQFAALQANRGRIAATRAPERLGYLQQFKRAIEQARPDIHAALQADFAKPVAETEATEIQQVIEQINFAIKRLEGWMQPKRVKTPTMSTGSKSWIQYEPRGVVLILAPWNYPLSLALAPLVGAVAAGNCAIVRPSERTPHTAQVIAKIIAAAFKPEHVTTVVGDIDTAEALLDLPFEHIFFTGSPRIGQYVMQRAAEHFSSVTLELGGKSPAIIDRSADLKRAAQLIVWGKFVNAGQTCVAPDHVWVQREQAQALTQLIIKQIERNYGKGDYTRLQSSDLANVIDANATARLRGLVNNSVAQGALVALGGQSTDQPARFAPTVLTNVKPTMAIMQEEIFGPILPILVYDQIDEVIMATRASGKPLTMAIFSENQAIINWLLREIPAGSSVINGVLLNLANPHLPFGGVGQSGMGNYYGFYSFKTFSHERAVFQQGGLNLVNLFQPPYRGVGKRLMAWSRSMLNKR